MTFNFLHVDVIIFVFIASRTVILDLVCAERKLWIDLEGIRCGFKEMTDLDMSVFSLNFFRSAGCRVVRDSIRGH